MGQVKVPQKVKFFSSVLSSEPSFFDEIKIVLENKLGEVEEIGRRHPWNFSPAYTKELGDHIQRCFFVFKNLDYPDKLPDWKICTNKIELEFSLSQKTICKRKINLDPGYLDGSQVIIASTKRYGNRIYLRDGIYADLTLFYNGQTYCPATKLILPDYRTNATVRYFNKIRKKYLKQIRYTDQEKKLPKYAQNI